MQLAQNKISFFHRMIMGFTRKIKSKKCSIGKRKMILTHDIELRLKFISIISSKKIFKIVLHTFSKMFTLPSSNCL